MGRVRGAGRDLWHGLVFFVGWLLSPLTFWNDAFVNIPIAYVIANVAIRIFRCDFLWAVLLSYWATNLLGLALMYAGSRKIAGEGRGVVRTAATIVMTVALYSLVFMIGSKTGVLKPLISH